MENSRVEHLHLDSVSICNFIIILGVVYVSEITIFLEHTVLLHIYSFSSSPIPIFFPILLCIPVRLLTTHVTINHHQINSTHQTSAVPFDTRSPRSTQTHPFFHQLLSRVDTPLTCTACCWWPQSPPILILGGLLLLVLVFQKASSFLVFWVVIFYGFLLELVILKASSFLILWVVLLFLAPRKWKLNSTKENITNLQIPNNNRALILKNRPYLFLPFPLHLFLHFEPETNSDWVGYFVSIGACYTGFLPKGCYDKLSISMMEHSLSCVSLYLFSSNALFLVSPVEEHARRRGRDVRAGSERESGACLQFLIFFNLNYSIK